jgi:hypothetical protein
LKSLKIQIYFTLVGMSNVATEAVRRRLIDQQNLKWWKGDKRALSRENINQLRNEFDIFYNPYYQRFSNLRKSKKMSCSKCNELGKVCTGVAPAMCPQCAVAGFKQADCVYLDNSLGLSAAAAGGGAPAYGNGQGGAAEAPIQPAVPNRAGAGLAIRLPVGRGSPTGLMNEENENNGNGVNTNASRDPNATNEEIAAGRAKRQARRNAAARMGAASSLNRFSVGRNESARFEAASTLGKLAAGGGGGKSRKRKQKNLKRKQKFTRKQK